MKTWCIWMLGASLASGALQAQTTNEWPNRPITVVVPGAPGGAIDNPTRLLAKRLGEQIGKPVVVVNKPGSAGIIGTQAALMGAPDGHTLLAGNIGPQAINYSAYASLPYKPGDLKALSAVISFPNVLVVNANTPIQSVPDLIAHLQREKSSSFGSAGLGQTTHLMGELFKLKTNTQAIHVPYKGSAPATLALLAGETTFMFDNLTQALPHIRSGKLRALAVTADRRVSVLPDVRTMGEVGYADLISSAWVGMFAASATPQPVLERMQKALTVSMADKALREQLVAMGGVPGELNGERFEAFVNTEREKWHTVIQKAGVKFE